MSERELDAAQRILQHGRNWEVDDWSEEDAKLVAAAYLSSRQSILEEAAKVADEMAVNRARVSGVAEHACKSIASRIRSLSHDGKAPAKEGDAG